MNRNNVFAPFVLLTLVVMTTLVMISTDLTGSWSQVKAQQDTAPSQDGEEMQQVQSETVPMPGLDGEVSPVLGEKRIVQHGIAYCIDLSSNVEPGR